MATIHPIHRLDPKAAAPVPAPTAGDPVAPAGERPLVLSVAQAAELLGVSEWLVLQQVRRGALPHRRVGRRIVLSRARLLAWLDGDSDDAVAMGQGDSLAHGRPGRRTNGAQPGGRPGSRRRPLNQR